MRAKADICQQASAARHPNYVGAALTQIEE